MKTTKANWRINARVIWAITAKDILEALKNKNAIAVILSSMFIVVAYSIIPNLTRGSEPPNVLVYDAGNSALLALLETSDAINLNTYPSEEIMKDRLTAGEVPELGLVIPAGIDQASRSGEGIELTGYVLSWVSEQKAVDLISRIEAEISRLAGTSVRIQLDSNRVSLKPDSEGIGNWAALGMVFAITMIGLTLIPHLMLEEKQSRTMDVLLVSPADAGKIVFAKALVGLFYCVLSAGIALVIYHYLVVHWWLAILGILCGSLFPVSLGLWLGMRIETRGQLTLWSWVLVIPLFVPIMLSMMEDLIPQGIIQVFRAIPTVVLFNLLRTAFADPIQIGTVILCLLWILVCTGVVLMAVTLRINRLDREEEAGLIKWWRARFASRVNQSVSETSMSENPPVLLRRASPDTSAEQRITPVSQSGSWGGLRIIAAIAGKDIREAIQNKLFLSILVGVAIMVGINSLLPLLLRSQNLPTAYLYDEGRSQTVRDLAVGDGYRLVLEDTRETMEAAVAGSPSVVLGLVIPADFDRPTDGQEAIAITGYSTHWAPPEKVNELASFFSEKLGLARERPVQIDVQGHVLYPSIDSISQSFILSLLNVIAILTIGIALVPLLLIEEKEGHTLDALRISPASYGQILFGKFLAGAFYCLLAALVLVLFNRYIFVHWEIAFLAIALGAFSAIAIGLLLGVFSNNPTTSNLWGALVMLAIIGLTMAANFTSPDWPAIVQSVLQWLPGAAMMKLFGLAMVGSYPVGMLWANVAAILGAAGLTYAGVLWLLHRADR
jgi:ABC-2 type transport system permease protein